MDNILKNDLEQKREKLNVSMFNKTDEQLTQNATANMKQMENLVDTRIFGGQVEQNQEAMGDFMHGHVLESAKMQIYNANYKVKQTIDAYDRAEITEEEKKEKDKQKQKTGNAARLVNKPAKAAKWKQGSHESSMLEALGEVNSMVDLNGVREVEALEKYTEKSKRYINKESGTYANALAKAGEAVKPEKRKEWTDNLHDQMVFGALPFLKHYKKGWFGRRYTLDGRRIHSKKGELSPEDYNKKLLKTLTLETRLPDSKNGVTLDKKKIEANRKAKGEMLGMLTKELLDYKLDVNKLNDRYLADHIVEIQEYADKLNGFQRLFQDNKWYFYGNEKKDIKDAEDQTFINLIRTRIFNTSDLLNGFLDAHYRSHGIRRNHYDKTGSDETTLNGTKDVKYHDRAGFIKDQYNNPDSLRAHRNAILQEQLNGHMHSFDIFDSSKLTEADRTRYQEKITEERNKADERLNKIREDLAINEKSFQNNLGAEIQNTIKKRMEKEAEETLKRYNANVKADPEMYKDIPFIKYESGAMGMENGIMLGDVKRMLLKNPRLYTAFGPEMDNIYAKLYASARLSAELAARKRALRDTMRQDQKRTADMAEYGEKMKDKHYVYEDMKQKYETAAKNKVFKYKSKNKHINYISEAVEDHMREAAKKEHDGIDKQLEYLRYNEKVCRKVIKFLAEGAKGLANKEDMKEVSEYLKSEKMGYLLQYGKIDEYNELMNDAVYKSRLKIKKADVGEDGNRPVDEVKEDRLVTERQRVDKVFKSRQFAAKKEMLQMAEGYYALSKDSSIEIFKWLALVDPTELAKFDLNWNMPAANMKEAMPSIRSYYRSNSVYLMMNDADQTFKRKDFYDRKFMRKMYKQLVEIHHIDENKEKFLHFMSRMQVQLEMISKIALKNRAIYKMNMNDNYALFDMDRIQNMSIEELKALEGEFEEKVKAEETKYGKNDGVGFEVLMERENKLNRIKEVRDMIKDYRIGLEAAKDYSHIGSDSFNNLLKQRLRKNRIAYLKDSKFFNANNAYLDLEDMFKENGDCKVAFDQKLFDYTSPKRKNANAKIDEKKIVGIIEKATHQLVSIPIDESLIEMIQKLNMNTDDMDEDMPVDTNVVGRLIRFCATFGSFEFIGDDYPQEYLGDEQKEIREVLNKPENAKLLLTIKTRTAALAPMYNMVSKFLGAYGFRMYGAKVEGLSGEELEEQKISQATAMKQLKDSMKIAGAEREKLIESIKAFKEKGADNIIADSTNELFERIYKSGEKLSINNMSAWKKKVEAMTKKGFFERDTEKGRWLRIAAQNMLANWPYSFEEFYKVRVMKDTGKALKGTIEAYGGKEAGQVFNLDNAGLYSEIITEHEVHKYTALNEEDRKNLDRRLVANGYDPNLIKTMFKPVNINGANMPATYTDRYNRERNKDLLDIMYKGIPALNQALRDKKPLDGVSGDYDAYAWASEMAGRLKEAVEFTITPEMLNEDYIASHFKELYEQSQKFALAKHFYDKYKTIWNGKDAREFFINKSQQIAFHNAFDLEGNSMFARFYDMINAFAKMHMVDENGGFDIGLENAEINQQKVDTKANLEKMKKAHAERRELFEKARDIVGTEVRRNKIATQIEKSDRVNNVLNAVTIKSDDKMLKMVQKRDFAGNIRDINLFVQDNQMTANVNDYLLTEELIDKDTRRVSELTDKINEYQKGVTETTAEIESRKNQGKETANLENKLLRLGQEIIRFKTEQSQCEKRIELNKNSHLQNEIDIRARQAQTANIYSLYNICHDEKGQLSAKKTMPNPADENKPFEVDTTIHFHQFHKLIATNMREIFNEFKGDIKAYGKNINNMFDRQRISEAMMNIDFPNVFRRYKQLDLYLGLLEQDSKSFAKKTAKKAQVTDKKNDPFVKTFANQKTEADNELKKFKKYNEQTATDLERIQYKRAVANARDCDDASFMLNEAFEDKETIQMLHDYINAVNATMVMHGVSADGTLIEDVVARESQGYYSKEQQIMIAHDYEAKGRELAKNIQESAAKNK